MMSSNHNQQYFTPENLKTLEIVLDRAGLENSEAAQAKDARRTAARFLIAAFQHGSTSEEALLFALANRLPAEESDRTIAGRSPSIEPEQVEGPGAQAAAYRFGKRVEADRTWTIYHVFSGIPAALGSWQMRGLNARTANRTLRTLNMPAADA